MRLPIALLVALSLPVLAQDKCDRVQTSLYDIEKGIYNSNLGAVCERTTARALGVADTLESYIKEHRCTNLSEVELELGRLEAELVMIDGLTALKQEVFSTQSELKRRTQWNQENHELAGSLVKDITLGATIEKLLNSEDIPKLFATADVEGVKWISHISDFCKKQEETGKVSPFCSSWKTYGPKFANDTKSVIPPNEVMDFMKDLKENLDEKKQLPKESKERFMQALALKVNGQDSTFQGLASEVEKVDLNTMLARIDHDRSKFNADQVKFIQNMSLAEADPSANHYVAQLRSRMKQRRDQAHIELQRNLLRQGFVDEADRLNARVKAKFHSAFGSPLKKADCLNLQDNQLAECIEKSLPPTSIDAQSKRLVRSLTEGARKAQEMRNLSETCSRPEMLNAMIDATPVANDCTTKIAANRSEVHDKRVALQNLRKLMADGLEQDLRFRDAAFEYLKNNCQNVAATELISAQCRGVATISTEPVITFASETMFALKGGLRASTVLTDKDCEPGKDSKFVILCETVHRGKNTPTPTPKASRSKPETLSTDVSKRKNDGIVLDAAAGAINDVGNAFLQRRFQPRPMQQGFQTPAFRPMPYSTPINMGLSDFVYTTARVYGGYGGYYKCSTCGFGSGPASFNSYWGMSSTPTPGMGSNGLMGVGLSSRFFGASSTTLPMTGSFNF